MVDVRRRVAAAATLLDGRDADADAVLVAQDGTLLAAFLPAVPAARASTALADAGERTRTRHTCDDRSALPSWAVSRMGQRWRPPGTRPHAIRGERLRPCSSESARPGYSHIARANAAGSQTDENGAAVQRITRRPKTQREEACDHETDWLPITAPTHTTASTGSNITASTGPRHSGPTIGGSRLSVRTGAATPACPSRVRAIGVRPNCSARRL